MKIGAMSERPNQSTARNAQEIEGKVSSTITQPSKKLPTERRSPIIETERGSKKHGENQPDDHALESFNQTKISRGALNIEAIRARSSRGDGRKVGKKNSDTAFHTSSRPTAENNPGKASRRNTFTEGFARVTLTQTCSSAARL